MNSLAARTTDRALRRLFLTLFLRGRGARGLQKDSAPGSIASKLWLSLGLNALIGVLAIAFIRQGVFALSLYMHSMTFMMLGMFVAASAGEVLFNKEEAEILLHRPVSPRALLRAKLTVMVQVACWIAGALNLAAFGVGIATGDGGWLFVPAHVLSVLLSALFAVGTVVASYQLGLKWIGRERLDSLLTTVQVLVSVSFIVGAQILPRAMERVSGTLSLTAETWWLALLPPAWFASIDDVIAGAPNAGTFIMAGIGVLATAAVVYLAFVALAGAFGRGLQSIQDVSTVRPEKANKRWLHALVKQPPLSWWLRDPVARASFLLVAAYMLRDREVKLRLYPAIAPIVAFPVIWIVGFGNRGEGGNDFGLALGSAYLCLVPLNAMNLLEFSQQWAASDVFRVAPVAGPAQILNGTRRAVLVLLALPVFTIICLVALAFGQSLETWPVAIPGLLALPVCAMIGCVLGTPVPLSRPIEEAKSANRGAYNLIVMFAAVALGFVAMSAWKAGHIWTMVLIELIVSIPAYIMCRQLVQDARWRPIN